MRAIEYEFLERVACGSKLPPSIGSEDLMRQRCRQYGWVAYKNAKWRVTNKGYRALELAVQEISKRKWRSPTPTQE